jgi:hypothetical protein
MTMQRSILILLLLTVTFAQAAPHEFFISICTIKHDTASDELQITLKLTTHDMEYALEKQLGGIAEFGGRMELPAAEQALKEYLLDNLIIRTHVETLDLEYLGKEVEYEDMYCYLQVSGVDGYKLLEIRNSILFTLSPDQSNIIHVENSRGRKTKTCTQNEPVVRFTP